MFSKLLFCVIVCVIALELVTSKEGKSNKLQIGIKKRVDNCAIKSKRGDLLHMHYTVCSLFITLYNGLPINTHI